MLNMFRCVEREGMLLICFLALLCSSFICKRVEMMGAAVLEE